MKVLLRWGVMVRWFWSFSLTYSWSFCTMMITVKKSLLCRLYHFVSFVITLMTCSAECRVLVGPWANSIDFVTLQAFPLVFLSFSISLIAIPTRFIWLISIVEVAIDALPRDLIWRRLLSLWVTLRVCLLINDTSFSLYEYLIEIFTWVLG